jgi:hypothetical protein
MEVQLSVEKQARLKDFAARTGVTPRSSLWKRSTECSNTMPGSSKQSKKAGTRRGEASCWNMMTSWRESRACSIPDADPLDGGRGQG